MAQQVNVLYTPAGEPLDDPPTKLSHRKTAPEPAIVTRPSHVRPVIDIARFDAFPQAARARELTKAVNTFASSGKNVFMHYVEPTLNRRRTELLKTGMTKKKYHKTAAQLWPSVEQEERSFWNGQAKELRLCLKEKSLSVENCLTFAGRAGDDPACSWHAEVAVSQYLGTPLPAPLDGDASTPHTIEQEATTSDVDSTRTKQKAAACVTAPQSPSFSHNDIETTTQRSSVDANVDAALDLQGLLDVLPERFEIDRNTLYGNFANVDFEEIHQAEGRTQTMYLRRVAQMLDYSGKELFHYYMVPRLCTSIYPQPDGSTVTSISAGIWKSLSGSRKGMWLDASNKLKKDLGDGDLLGLETLMLESLDTEVVRLRRLAKEDLEDHWGRKRVRWESK